MKLIICLVCDKVFEAKRKQKYCLECAEIKEKEQKAEWYKNKKAEEDKTPKTSKFIEIEKQCEGCSTIFIANQKNRRFCSNCRYDRRKQITDKYNVKRSETRILIIEESHSMCDICGETKPENLLVIDHDHNCCPPARACAICIRGVLCNSCNSGLGNFQDSPFLMSRAIEYLRRFDMRNGDPLSIAQTYRA